MTSASGKSRAVKDPARCSRAVNMTVTAAPVANGQSWVRGFEAWVRRAKTQMQEAESPIESPLHLWSVHALNDVTPRAALHHALREARQSGPTSTSECATALKSFPFDDLALSM